MSAVSSEDRHSRRRHDIAVARVEEASQRPEMADRDGPSDHAQYMSKARASRFSAACSGRLLGDFKKMARIRGDGKDVAVGP